MKAYHQSDLLEVLISMARNPALVADAQLQAAYNEKRCVRALKSLRSRNIFLYTEGTRTSTDLNNTNTIYTQPAGERLLVLGYSDNFRYGAVTTETAAGPNPTALTLLQTHRVRVVGGNERTLIDDFVPAQAGVSGQPRYTNAQLVAPTILEPNEQIAIDLGYDPAGGAAPADIPPQAFIIFCLRVKDKLSALDQETFADVQRFINAEPVQRSLFLNCFTNDPSVGAGAAFNAGYQVTGLDGGSAAGQLVSCFTPPVNVPVLITGIGSNLEASKLTISDLSDGSSFSLNRPMQSSALNLPGYENSTDLTTAGAPVVGPNWTSYYALPMPHLLKRGAQLRADIVNGGDAGAGPGTITEQQVITQLVFQAITV